MTKSNRLGCYSRFGYELPMDIRIDMIKKAGFSATSILLSEEEDLVRTGQKDTIPALVSEKGLFLENVHAPFLDYNNLWSKNKYTRESVSKILVSCIDFCGTHDIPVVVTHISKGNDVPDPNVDGLNAFRYLVEYAETVGVILALENTRKNGHLDYLLSRIDSPNLGLCYDSGHDFLYSADPVEILTKWGHLLVATHLHDNNGSSDNHWLPEKGAHRWRLIKELFPRASYKGPVSLEAFPRNPEKETGESFLVKAFNNLVSLNLVSS